MPRFRFLADHMQCEGEAYWVCVMGSWYWNPPTGCFKMCRKTKFLAQVRGRRTLDAVVADSHYLVDWSNSCQTDSVRLERGYLGVSRSIRISLWTLGPNSGFRERRAQIINLINLLRCHGINKDDHVWWYEAVSKCRSRSHKGVMIFFYESVSKIRCFFFSSRTT